MVPIISNCRAPELSVITAVVSAAAAAVVADVVDSTSAAALGDSVEGGETGAGAEAFTSRLLKLVAAAVAAAL